MSRKAADTLLVLIFLFVVTPWMFSAYLTWKAGNSLDKVNAVLSQSVEDRLTDTGDLSRNLRGGGITGQPDIRKVRARYAQLRSYAALPDQVIRANSSVDLVMLDFKRDSGWEIPVGVDVSGMTRSALVLVSNASLHVDISGAGPGLRGKIAVESPLPVDMTGLQHGLLAGLKVPRGEAPVINSIYTDKKDVLAVCRHAIDWQRHFGVRPEALNLWHVSQSSEGMKLSRSGGRVRLASDGGRLVNLGNLKRVCRELEYLFHE